MRVNQIRLELKDFRAIEEANIILDGITVVAGENGCGKSTLSKFLYYVFKTSNEYENLIFKELKRALMNVSDFLKEIERLIDWYEGKLLRSPIEDLPKLFGKRKRSYPSLNDRLIVSLNTLEDQSIWIETIDDIFEEYEFYFKKNDSELVKIRMNRLFHVFEDSFSLRMQFEDNDDFFVNQKSYLLNTVKTYFNEAKEKIEKRPVYPFVNSLRSAFNEKELPHNYSVLEYDVPIVDEETISRSHSIRKTSYVDTPMSLGAFGSFNHWADLNGILSEGESFDREENFIDTAIKEEIIKGDSFYSRDSGFSNKFIYVREDGKEFNLLDCATGIKSFAMLQMMLKNGFLDKYTLLIIDEPETHLHPQWIVEYARLIVLLNKHIGVKFFIASHNPDMVSAIKYISEKEEVESNLNFYLAEKNNNTFQYSYKELGTDIEPIFESFNIALSRIYQYGTKGEEE